MFLHFQFIQLCNNVGWNMVVLLEKTTSTMPGPWLGRPMVLWPTAPDTLLLPLHGFNMGKNHPMLGEIGTSPRFLELYMFNVYEVSLKFYLFMLFLVGINQVATSKKNKYAFKNFKTKTCSHLWSHLVSTETFWSSRTGQQTHQRFDQRPLPPKNRKGWGFRMINSALEVNSAPCCQRRVSCWQRFFQHSISASMFSDRSVQRKNNLTHKATSAGWQWLHGALEPGKHRSAVFFGETSFGCPMTHVLKNETDVCYTMDHEGIKSSILFGAK